MVIIIIHNCVYNTSNTYTNSKELSNSDLLVKHNKLNLETCQIWIIIANNICHTNKNDVVICKKRSNKYYELVFVTHTV